MPLEPSVTSASMAPRLCTLRYSSVLLPKSSERPGPKSVSPAMYCSGVEVVVWCICIVDMRCSICCPKLEVGAIKPEEQRRVYWTNVLTNTKVLVGRLHLGDASWPPRALQIQLSAEIIYLIPAMGTCS